MSGADALADAARSAGAPPRGARRPPEAARRLSDRTSLRTKLITAVLVLVIIALAAISVASAYMVRGYLTTQHDSELLAQVSAVNITTHLPQGVDRGYRRHRRTRTSSWGCSNQAASSAGDTGHRRCPA